MSSGRSSKSSASVFVPSSVSKRYSFSTGTHGSSRRRRASSSLRRVSSFSASSSSSRAASHSSRVPILWPVIVYPLSLVAQNILALPATDDVSHRWRESRNPRGHEDDQDSKSYDR